MLRDWYDAGQIDDTIRVKQRQISRLRRKQVSPVRYARELLFRSMRHGRPIIFGNHNVPIGSQNSHDPAAVADLIAAKLKRYRARVRVGKAEALKQELVPSILARWKRGGSTLAVTDLHVRTTPSFETSTLGHFATLIYFRSRGMKPLEIRRC